MRSISLAAVLVSLWGAVSNAAAPVNVSSATVAVPAGAIAAPAATSPGSEVPSVIPPGETSVIPQEPAPVQAAADTGPTLDQQLEALSVPTNQALPGVSEESLYSVQSRYVSLRHRHEFTLGGGKNFNSDSFVTSNNLDLGYRFYLSDRWFLGLNGSYVFNDWSNGANRLIQTDEVKYSTLADVALARYRADLLAGYHLFYGKFRVSMDQVFYFDHYIALGPGYVDMVLGNQFAAVAETGLVFWFGRNMSLRFSVKDYFVREITENGRHWAHNIIGGLQIGYVFGG